MEYNTKIEELANKISVMRLNQAEESEISKVFKKIESLNKEKKEKINKKLNMIIEGGSRNPNFLKNQNPSLLKIINIDKYIRNLQLDLLINYDISLINFFTNNLNIILLSMVRKLIISIEFLINSNPDLSILS